MLHLTAQSRRAPRGGPGGSPASWRRSPSAAGLYALLAVIVGATVSLAPVGPVYAAKKPKAAKAAKPPAAAKPAKKALAPEDEAKKLFGEGNVFFDSGQFDRALGAFTAAYETFPLAGILVNIAQCHRNLGNYEQSIFFYKKYLAEVPDSPLIDAIKDVVKEMGEKRTATLAAEAERLAAEKATAEAAIEKERKVRAALEAETAAAAARTARLGAEAEEARLKAIRAARPFYQRAWFWTVVGGALLLAGGATTAGVLAAKPAPDGSLGRWDCRSCSF